MDETHSGNWRSIPNPATDQIHDGTAREGNLDADISGYDREQGPGKSCSGSQEYRMMPVTGRLVCIC